jgi:hypothetical protein
VDTNYLDQSHGHLVFFWSNSAYWKLYDETPKLRRLQELLGTFDPKHPPTIRPADVLKALATVYEEEATP